MYPDTALGRGMAEGRTWGWTGKANAGVHRMPFEAGTRPLLLSRAARARDQIAGASAVRSVRHSPRLSGLSPLFGFFHQLQIIFCVKTQLSQNTSVTEFPHEDDTTLRFLFCTSSPSFLSLWVWQAERASLLTPGGACRQAKLFTGAFCPRGWSGREVGSGGRLSWWIEELWGFGFFKKSS